MTNEKDVTVGTAPKDAEIPRLLVRLATKLIQATKSGAWWHKLAADDDSIGAATPATSIEAELSARLAAEMRRHDLVEFRVEGKWRIELVTNFDISVTPIGAVTPATSDESC